MATAHFRGPKPYTPGADFSLWRRRFESYARAAKIPQDQLSDALLADAAFRAFDLLGLTEAVQADYKKLVQVLSRQFASTTGEPALRFQLGLRHQEAAETLDEFADALLDLANQAYPEVDSDVRMRLARDRFEVGVRADYIQENLLQTPQDSLEDVRKVAKRLEAARAARRQMQRSSKTKAVHSLESNPDREEESPRNTGREVTMVTVTSHVARFSTFPTAIPALPSGRPASGCHRISSCLRLYCGHLLHQSLNCYSVLLNSFQQNLICATAHRETRIGR